MSPTFAIYYPNHAKGRHPGWGLSIPSMSAGSSQDVLLKPRRVPVPHWGLAVSVHTTLDEIVKEKECQLSMFTIPHAGARQYNRILVKITAKLTEAVN